MTRENFDRVIALKTTPEQAAFVRPNLHSLAEAAIEPTWTPLAICAGDDPVGFATIGQHEPSGRWCIMLLMIGAEHQGNGYGVAALGLLASRIVERHAAREIYLGYHPVNAVAARLYARFGFAPTGEIDDGNIIARLEL